MHSIVIESAKSVGGYQDAIAFLSVFMQSTVLIITVLLLSVLTTSYIFLCSLVVYFILSMWNKRASLAGKINNDILINQFYVF